MGSSNHGVLVSGLLTSGNNTGAAVRSLAGQLPEGLRIADLVAMPQGKGQDEAVGQAGQALRAACEEDAVLKDSEFAAQASALPKPNKAWNAVVRALMAEAAPAGGGAVVAAGAAVKVTVEVTGAAGAASAAPGSEPAEENGAGEGEPPYLAAKPFGEAVEQVAARVSAGGKKPDTFDHLRQRVEKKLRDMGFKQVSEPKVAPALAAYLKTRPEHVFYNLLPESERAEAERQPAPPAPAASPRSLVEELTNGLGRGSMLPGGSTSGTSKSDKPKKPAAATPSASGRRLSPGEVVKTIVRPAVAQVAASLYNDPSWRARALEMSLADICREIATELEKRREAYRIPAGTSITGSSVLLVLADAIRDDQREQVPVLTVEAAQFYTKLLPKREADASRPGGYGEGYKDARRFWADAPDFDTRMRIALLLADAGDNHAAAATALGELADCPVDVSVVQELVAKDPFWLLLRYGGERVDEGAPVAWQARLAITTALVGTLDGAQWQPEALAERLVNDMVLSGRPVNFVRLAQAWLTGARDYATKLGLDASTIGKAHAAMMAFQQKNLLGDLRTLLLERVRFLGVQKWVNSGGVPPEPKAPAEGEGAPNEQIQQKGGTKPIQPLDPREVAKLFLETHSEAAKAALGLTNEDEVVDTTALVVAYVACSKTLRHYGIHHGEHLRRVEQPAAHAPTTLKPPAEPTDAPKGATEGDARGQGAADGSGSKVSVSSAGAPAPTEEKTGEKPGGEVPAPAEPPKPPKPQASTAPANPRETGPAPKGADGARSTGKITGDGTGDDTTQTLVSSAMRNGRRAVRARGAFRAALKRVRELSTKLTEAEAAKAQVDAQLATAKDETATAKQQADQQLTDQGQRLQRQIDELTGELRQADANLEELQRQVDAHPQAIADAADAARLDAQGAAQAAVDIADGQRTEALQHAARMKKQRNRAIRHRRPWKVTGVVVGLLALILGIFLWVQVGKTGSLRDTLAQRDQTISELQKTAQAPTPPQGAVDPNELKTAALSLGLPGEGTSAELVRLLVKAAQDATTKANASQGELAAMKVANSTLADQLKAAQQAAANRPLVAPAPSPAPTLDPEKSLALKLAAVQAKRDTSNRFPEVEPVAKAIFDEIPATERVTASNLLGDQWVNFIQPYIAKHRDSNLAALAAVKARYGKLAPNLSSVEKDANGKLTLESSILWTQVLDQTRNRVKELLQIDAAAQN